ncbi:MAG: hypothetical protein QXS15_02225 [Candidatus Jordarchaeales archaeon]
MYARISKWIRERIMLRQPPNTLITIMLVVFALFFLSGGAYLLINPPPISFGFISNRLQDQYAVEGIVVAVLIFTSFAGFILMYEGTKNPYNPSYATKLIAVGLILIIVAVVILHLLLISKAPWLFQAS